MSDRQVDPGYRSLVRILRGHAVERPDRVALVMLADGETEQARLTYAELDARVRAVAGRMRAAGLAGERVMILLPSSVEYVVGFLACLYAGAVPVPLNPPSRSANRDRIDHVVVDCQPRLAIVASTTGLMAHLPDEYGCQLWAASELSSLSEADLSGSGVDRAGGQPPHAGADTEPHAGPYAGPDAGPDAGADAGPDPGADAEPHAGADAGPHELAYLQYTSGSTSQPKGVMVSQENLVHQVGLFSTGFGLRQEDVVVTWLPLFHDFGLIAGLLTPLVLGTTTVMMPPQMFVQQPLRWLTAITRYGATVSFSPNFPLELCVERVSDDELRDLDLGSWRVLAMGAEPIRPDTLDRFAARFSGCGFRTGTFRPGYGMAESTLAVSTTPARPAPRVLHVDVSGFGQGVVRPVPADVPSPRQQRLLSNGPVVGDTELLIVDPNSHEPLPEGQEGEVWLRGRTVALGYWDRPEETERTFGARLADGSGPYLRTGDLGTLLDGEVYLTSRLKDLIIIRGRNHHPQDIELTVSDAHPALPRGLGAAFSVDVDGEERLVVAQELRRTERGRHDLDEVARQVRAAVVEEHDVVIDTVVFLRPASLPVTTSGKVRRQYTRQLYLGGALKTEYVSGPQPVGDTAALGGAQPVDGAAAKAGDARASAGTGTPAGGDGTPVAGDGTPSGPGPDEVARWLRTRVAALAASGGDVPLDATFGSLGLDSAAALRLTGELAGWLGRRVDPTLLYSHPTIARLAAAVTGTVAADQPAATGTGGPAPASAADAGRPADEPLAVVGMAGVFPGAGSVDEFWTMLAEGRDAIVELPESRRADVHGPVPARPAGYLPDVAGFDARFFGVSAEEAAAMDPQQRLLLTCVWRALEDAGIPAESLAGTACGVFVGIATNDYRQLMVRDHAEPGAYTGTGTALSVAAGRISYFLDLTGPAVAVDTACSSSLVAVHQAVQSLRRGECDAAIVAGVNLLLDPELTEALTEAGMMSPTSRCRTFDSAADGYVRGEGCGVVVLKRRSDAVRDNDRVHALVLGTAINQDGRSNTLTAPNGMAQQAVLRQALRSAGVTPGDVGYLEAHGTGTSLGDPIEMSGITTVYGDAAAGTPLWVGSVKTNIGHLEAAAGIAGLIKSVLVLRHGTIPPHLHLDRLNPLIDLAGTRCRIATTAEPWPTAPGRPRAAAVSSFGFSGTNAHVVLGQAPDPEPASDPAETANDDTDRWRLLPLSARGEWALGELTDRMIETLATVDQESSPTFAQLCAAAATRRNHLPHRLTVVARCAKEAAEALREHRDGTPSAFVLTSTAHDDSPTSGAWLFPGQGFQRVGMAAPYHHRWAVVRDALADCDRIIRADLGVSLLPTLTGDSGETVDLDETRFGQPAMFAVQYALARLWQSSGARPGYLVGHSLGEYTAACLAGVLSLDDALGLVLLRARLMQSTAPGAMYAIRTDRLPELLAELADGDGDGDGEVVAAALNSPVDVTISGTEAATGTVAARWRERGARVTRLTVRRAFHSPLMDPVVEEFAATARRVHHGPATVPVVSTLTGEVLTGTALTGEHWVRQLRQPVRFADALRTLGGLGVRLFTEMSPEPVLSPLGPRTVPDATWLVSGERQGRDERRLLLSLAQWYTRGGSPDWAALDGDDPDRPARPVPLPGHPLRPVRHWYAAGVPRTPVPDATAGHPLLGNRLDLAGAGQVFFDSVLSHTRPWFIDQHRVGGVPVLPGTAMIEWAGAAARAVLGEGRSWTLEDVRFTTAVPLPAGRSAPAQTVVDPATGSVSCFARDAVDAPWVQRAQVGSVRRGAGQATGGAALLALAGTALADAGTADAGTADAGTADAGTADAVPTGTALAADASPAGTSGGRHRAPEGDPGNAGQDRTELDVAAIYDRLTASGIDYGPAFRGVRQLWRAGEEALGRVSVTLPAAPEEAYLLHPVVLDACFHVAAAFVPELTRPLVPVAAGSVRVHDRLPTEVWCHARWGGVRESGEHTLDLRVLGVDGTVLVEIDGLSLRPLPESALAPDAPPLRRQVVRWVPAPEPTGADGPTGHWVVLGPEAGAVARARQQLSDAGLAVSTLVTDGADETTQELVDRLRAGQPELAGVLVAGAVTTSGGGSAQDGSAGDGSAGEDHPDEGSTGDVGDDRPGDAFDRYVELSRRTLLPLGRLLAAYPGSRPTLVVHSARAVALPDEPVDLAAGALTGLATALIGEYPQLRVVQVDTDQPGGQTVDTDQLDGDPVDTDHGPDAVEVLTRALATAGSGRLAVRDGRWLAARLAAERLAPGTVALRADATYLVTGGWGALGRVAAGELVRLGARHLVLTGRTVPHPLPGWVDELETLGVEVVLRTPDLTDDRSVAGLLTEIVDRMPPLRGVVHAAGTTDDGALGELDRVRLDRVLGPKAGGAWRLHRLTRDLPLDFFVLYSSLASLVGSAGQANYVLANAFLDTLTAVRQRAGLPAVSVNWGPWAEGGIATRDGNLERLTRSGVYGITDGEGAAALSGVLSAAGGPSGAGMLSAAGGQLGLAKVDWDLFATALARPVPYDLLADLAAGFGRSAAGYASVDLRERAVTDPAAAEEELVALLLTETAVLLGLGAADRAELSDGFARTRLSTLGLDSLMAMRLRNRLLAVLAVELPNEFLFDGSTVGEVSRWLTTQLALRNVVTDTSGDGQDTDGDDEEIEVLVI